MNTYKLLTPGPLTTSDKVKEQMLTDRCTWDDDYKIITQKIRRQLLEITNVSKEKYTSVLMQGSGSFGVESTLNSAISNEDKCLFIVNGAYGERMVAMAEHMKMNYIVYRTHYDNIPNVKVIEDTLKKDNNITHIAMVHCETTTGILNPLSLISDLCKEYNKIFIVDAMSSFGGIHIDIEKLDIDYLVSSANKCIQGVPGFSFVIAKLDRLINTKGNSTSLVMDLYDQWQVMDVDGKWRYTSPTHVVAAFSKAIDELIDEGGVEARYNRYNNNNKILRTHLNKIGFKPFIIDLFQSPIITTFVYPSNSFNFNDFYMYVKKRGFVIYPR